MSNGIEFDGDNTQYTHVPGSGTTGGFGGNEPKMVRWLMKKGIVTSANAAQNVLVGVVIVNIVIIIVALKYLL